MRDRERYLNVKPCVQSKPVSTKQQTNKEKAKVKPSPAEEAERTKTWKKFNLKQSIPIWKAAAIG